MDVGGKKIFVSGTSDYLKEKSHYISLKWTKCSKIKVTYHKAKLRKVENRTVKKSYTKAFKGDIYKRFYVVEQ